MEVLNSVQTTCELLKAGNFDWKAIEYIRWSNVSLRSEETKVPFLMSVNSFRAFLGWMPPLLLQKSSCDVDDHLCTPEKVPLGPIRCPRLYKKQYCLEEKRENKNRWMELQKRSEKARTFSPPLLEHTIPKLYVSSKKVSYPSYE